MEMTGTFMPAYGLNRLFGELPLIGLILGNGNDRDPILQNIGGSVPTNTRVEQLP